MKDVKHRFEKRRFSVWIFNLNLEVYFVVITFIALLYRSSLQVMMYWPFFAVIVWGLLLLLQFLLVFRRDGRNRS
ncbi:2TM domain-containing protein [Terrimonas sp. NA20]|uniref:2TM domain-containing protein n=1 Tax=Terrimonas ginsenosidimutans TaxID=2908004 RepID=A0ABS9KVC2_9BACT|nr:2TM domain-containing protein [Terrimonas ginsenosidimutans]MCG2616294.1 2TM domain-containing protein [Terrimonas ginsenosidimutans]